MEFFKTALYWAKEFNDEGLHIIFLVIGLVYFAFQEDEKKHRYLMLGYTVTLLLVYFCPLVVWFMDKLIGELVYWRMLWLMPMPLMIAYFMVKVWAKMGHFLLKAGVLVFFVISLGFMGQNVYTENSPYAVKSNWEKLPSSPVALVDIVNQDRGEKENWARIAAPEDMVEYIMQYDATLHQLYGRKGKCYSKYIKKCINNNEIASYDKFCKKLRKKKCNYVVLRNGGHERDENMNQRDFVLIGQVGDYNIYRDARWSWES